MSASTEANDEDEVEFVSEGALRPVLECIDLLSDSEDDARSPMVDTIGNEIDRQKAQVTSTLDRLALQVAVEKQERADKCKAFKEKLITQKAHGQGQLAISSGYGQSYNAMCCVDMWLKMPGVKPGALNTGASWRHRPASFPTSSSSTHTCPVMNCGRVYDNVLFLEGHLKRFDHSPCDPTIYLKGSPSQLCACIACGLHFESKEVWKSHLKSKVSSSNAEGHASTQTCQSIVCFACPACYLFFTTRDECLQHMSARNHFSQSITLSDETQGTALPIPIPSYAKNRLIALCKDVVFKIRCTACRKVLKSHMEAQAHFNVQCRLARAIAESEKTVVQVMRQLPLLGQCSPCRKMFLNQDQVQKHKELTQHEVEVNSTIKKAILQYCHFCETQHAKRATVLPPSEQSKGPETQPQKRDTEKNDSLGSPAKRQRLGPGVHGSTGQKRGSVLAWFCECGLRFPEDATARNHLLAANQIFHQCCVCGKQMVEASIARLHMCRIHGGAHLSNYLFHCRVCNVDMPRQEDILLHVSETHSGHTYLTEREVPKEEPATVPYAKPSTSSTPSAATGSRVLPTTTQTPSPKQDERWVCRMCEDYFDSKSAVYKHCRDMSSHSFQRFVCGHCPQKFFKEATLRRHCVNEHGNQIEMRYFCGLCDSIQYDSEEELQKHYRSLHSEDYYRMDEPEVDTPSVAENTCQLATTSKSLECLCMASKKGEEERKATFTACFKRIVSEGKTSFVCSACDIQVPSYAQIKTHLRTRHTASKLENTYDVVCGFCQESHKDIPSFHIHYHSHHCPLQPCLSSRAGGVTEKAASSTVKTLNAEEIKTDVNAEKFEDVKHVFALNTDEAKKDMDSNGDESDEEMRHALALSAEEAKKSTDLDIEMEETLKRSVLDF